MIHNVFLATDGSRYAEGAARYSVWSAAAFDTKLIGCYVMDRKVLDGPFITRLSMMLGFTPAADFRAAAEPVLRSLGESALGFVGELCGERGVELVKLILEGPVASTLVDAAKNSELMVIGRQGDHAEYEYDVLGNVADAVLRRSPRALMLAPADFEEPVGAVLLYDEPTAGGEALRYALALPEELPLTVLHTPELADKAAGELESYGRSAELGLLEEPAAVTAARRDSAELVILGADTSHGHLVVDPRVQRAAHQSRSPLLISP